MNAEDKQACKKMISQAIAEYREYNRAYIALYAEKRLLWAGMESVLDFYPANVYRRHQMFDYLYKMMSRILDI